MEQGIEVGFVSITGSPSDADEVAYASDEKYSKQLGSESYFTYTFEKPILFSGYMIKTGAGAEGFGQPKDWTVRVNDKSKGKSDILIHEVKGEAERGPHEEKNYQIAEEKEVWTDSVTINIPGRTNDEENLEITRFSIITSEKCMEEN